MNRRQSLSMGVALAATAAGAGWAGWRTFKASVPSMSVESTLWDMNFQQPDGAQLAMQAFRGRPLLLNFWATWCPPCVQEMPLLDKFYRMNKSSGWQVVGLAVDDLDSVQKYLSKLPVEFAIGLAGPSGIELSRSLGNYRGALPFSAVIDRTGHNILRRLGTFTHDELNNLAKS